MLGRSVVGGSRHWGWGGAFEAEGPYNAFDDEVFSDMTPLERGTNVADAAKTDVRPGMVTVRLFAASVVCVMAGIMGFGK